MRFNTTYTDLLRLIHEETGSRVGFFPGCFSPPHLGHYMTAKQMCVENDTCYIIASDSCRDPKITTDMMVQIWEIYISAMEMDHIKLKVVSGSPVAVTYQAVNLLNNDGELVTSKPMNVSQQAEDIYDGSKGSNIDVSLYAGDEDFKGRYSSFFSDGVTYKGNQVVNITGKPVKRFASGTDTRSTIHDIAIGLKDTDTLRGFLPGPGAGANFTGRGFLTSEQEDQVISILLS